MSDKTDTVKSQSSNEKPVNMVQVVPGYKYLGPGNEADNGPPVNTVDKIAKKHDEDYEKITKEHNVKCDLEESKRKIREADEEFIKNLKDVKPSTAHEFIGKHTGIIGILLKSILEMVTDTLVYPPLKPCEAKNDKRLEESDHGEGKDEDREKKEKEEKEKKEKEKEEKEKENEEKEKEKEEKEEKEKEEKEKKEKEEKEKEEKEKEKEEKEKEEKEKEE